MCLKVSQNSQENKAQACNFVKKDTPTQVISCVNFVKFLRPTISIEHLWWLLLYKFKPKIHTFKSRLKHSGSKWSEHTDKTSGMVCLFNLTHQFFRSSSLDFGGRRWKLLLDVLFARFLHPGTPQLTILSFLKRRSIKIIKADKLVNLTYLNENLLLIYLFSKSIKKVDLIFHFDYNDIRAFEVFKWTAGRIFKCETIKMKLAKDTEEWIFKQKLFCVM